LQGVFKLSRARLIINPAAGAGKTARKWPHIKALLKNDGVHFDHDITEAPGHARELAKAAAKNGYELVVSVGGDGTIHEVVNGLHDEGCISDVNLGIISTGTGSDFVRTIGIPHSYEDACRNFANPRKITIDVGAMEYGSNGSTEKRVFVNFAGFGFDAEVVKATTGRFKKLGGTPSYLVGLLSTFLLYKNRKVIITIDGEDMEGKVCTALLGNGRYSGGGMLTTPNADPSDGLFDVMVVGDISKPDLLWSLPSIYKGNHLSHPKVTVKRAREVAISSAEPLSLQADGELLGELPARFSIIPSALNICV